MRSSHSVPIVYLNHSLMKSDFSNSSRREFVGALTLGATGFLASMPGVLQASQPEAEGNVSEADEWFKKVKGKHRIVYDATEPHDGFPILWSWVFYKTNNQTGTMDNDMTAVVVLRHNAIPFAMEDGLWTKYKFGERFHVNDPATSRESAGRGVPSGTCSLSVSQSGFLSATVR